ncbi:MAG: hypothetical protein MK102_11325 [Fuerstiella sp.]|nr:hypothetical protein [Fuerstiella sp.]
MSFAIDRVGRFNLAPFERIPRLPGTHWESLIEMPDKGLQTDNAVTRKTVFRGTLAALICAIVGGALIATGNAASGLGVTMFLFLPAATGFVTVLTVRYWKAVVISLLIAMTLCLAGLVFTGLEGIVCVVMATPILLIGAMLGAAAGTLVKRRFPTDGNLSMAIIPVLAGVSVFGTGKIEDLFDTGWRTEIVESTIIVPADPGAVWDAMIEFDDIDGSTPLLMRMGLPIPQSCSTNGFGLGSERTCRFNSGFIRERVTAWNPPHRLELDVEEVQLPGRHWLGFQQATYTLERHGVSGTKLTRATTVTSTLRPAFYWRFFERLGTETEHNYILNSLKTKSLTVGE